MYINKIVVGFVAGGLSIVALGAVCAVLAVNASKADAANRKAKATMIADHASEIADLRARNRKELADAVVAAKKQQRARDRKHLRVQLAKAQQSADAAAVAARQAGESSGYANGQADGREEGYDEGMDEATDDITCSDDPDVPLPYCLD